MIFISVYNILFWSPFTYYFKPLLLSELQYVFLLYQQQSNHTVISNLLVLYPRPLLPFGAIVVKKVNLDKMW